MVQKKVLVSIWKCSGIGVELRVDDSKHLYYELLYPVPTHESQSKK